jgi:hypothetical protein
MNDNDDPALDPHAVLRAGLMSAIRACRDAEREIFTALDPAERDAPGPDGGWSAKDVLAHLSAWRDRQATKLAAAREGRVVPEQTGTTDEVNAGFHASRAGWTWDRVDADADATAEALIAELAVAADALADSAVLGSIMSDGPEHDLAHLGPLAERVGKGSDVLGLADRTLAMLDRVGWPARSALVARYNLACYHALAGNLEMARSLLRQVLPEAEDLRTLAPGDDDLIALRDEITTLAAG